jgi:hypothetical protein
LSRLLAVAALAAAAPIVYAQWDIEDSHTTASLRGIASAGGTVLHTEDGGYMWQNCAMPPGAEKLDFRGIQAFDANTAIVMSSGKGELSRLYITSDGCGNWKLLLTNPDPEGFWESVKAADPSTIIILGNPVDGAFQIRQTTDGGITWTVERTEQSWPDESAFPVSNSSLSVNWVDGPSIFGTSSPAGARLFRDCYSCKKHKERWVATPMSTFAWNDSAGISAIHQSTWDHLVAVGGDYLDPDSVEQTAAWSNDGGRRWHRAQAWPHGYRSAVDYDAVSRAWISVGPNGTDISRDDGRNWRPLKPGPGEPADADQNWNALSLPFAVGPNGRIGKLRPVPEP